LRRIGLTSRFREVVSSAHTTKQSHAPTKPFYSLRKHSETQAGYRYSNQQWSSIMWDFIFSLIYRQSCRNICRSTKAAGVGVMTVCPFLSTVPFDFGAWE